MKELFVVIDKLFKKYTIGNKFHLKENQNHIEDVKRSTCSFHQVNEVLGKEMFMKEQTYSAKMSEFMLLPFLLTETYITLTKIAGVCLFGLFIHSVYSH